MRVEPKIKIGIEVAKEGIYQMFRCLKGHTKVIKKE